MAVLEKMRKRLGFVISIFIAVALLAFIVNPEDLQRVGSMFSSKYDVGKIAGKKISQQEFSKKVEYFNSIFNITNPNAGSEETSEMVNNAAWQSILADYVFLPACKKAGIKVGDEEMLDMITGKYISPVLENDPAFFNESGVYDKTMVQSLVQNKHLDPTGQTSLYWSFVENNMNQDRMFTKYNSMLSKSTFANNLQVRREIAENNNSYDIDFVILPMGFEKDTSIKVTNSEIKAYYEKIKSGLKRVESRDAEFVVFDILPSEEDVQAAKKEMDQLYEEFKGISDSDLKNYLSRNSDIPFNDVYFRKGELREVSSILDDFVSANGAGSYLEPQHFDDMFAAAKIIDVASRPDSVYLKYIPASDEKMADSLINVVKGGADFTALASLYLSPQANGEPGTIGWVTETVVYANLPQDFMKAFTSKKGDIFKAHAGDGYVVVKVDNLTSPVRKSKVAVLSRNITASRETFNNIYAEASEVIDQSGGDIAKFEKYALENHLTLIPADNILGGAKTIEGYDNMREISRWIFDKKEGDISNVFTIDNKYYFVAALKKIHPAGIAPLEDVSSQIKEYLTFEKRVDKLAKEASAKVGNASSLEAIAEALGTTVSSSEDVTFSSFTGGQQLDPAFIGMVAKAGADRNREIVGPVKGGVGVYYFQIKNTKNNAFYTESDAQRKSQNNLYSILQSLPQIMCNDAELTDSRYKFY